MLVRSRIGRNGLVYETFCLRCWVRSYVSNSVIKRSLARSPPKSERSTAQLPRPRSFLREYFSANGSLGDERSSGEATGPKTRPIWGASGVKQIEDSTARPPARDRRMQRMEALSTKGASQNHHTSDLLDRRKKLGPQAIPILGFEHSIPLDASSQLSTISATLPSTSLKRLLTTCLSLSKPRLSALMVVATAATYTLYPVPAVLLLSTTVAPSLSYLTLGFLTAGTALCSASANALNMLLEPQHDAKMSRTRNRPLVRGLITKRGALTFAISVGALGVGGLWFGVNPTVAFLGGFTIFLYAGVYTPLKRISVINTWVGAVVGSIPPLMGWAAAAGQYAAGSGEWQELLLGAENIGGWLLAGLLFAWQFPHFNALSWSIREEYKSAGYRMLCWTNTKMNGRVALRYSLLFFPICFGLTWYGVTDQGFLVTSSAINMWMVKAAWKFWRQSGHRGSARGLFYASVWHLPVVMGLAMVHKKGLWEGMWRSVFGEEDGGQDVWETEAEEEAEDLAVGQASPALPLAIGVTQ
ncbi:Protoheme IX farnesyltransferase, mitochondrial [Lambiella insularis]|nr:Protoheme IX farnesyltransferase, mitochondrial [Lambiella insularis]